LSEGELSPTDPFAEQLLVSTQNNSSLKNISSRSVILAPFNTNTSNDVEMSKQRFQMLKLVKPQKIIKFTARLAEINRQYELNNNAELDNGVYHQDSAGKASARNVYQSSVTGGSIQNARGN